MSNMSADETNGSLLHEFKMRDWEQSVENCDSLSGSDDEDEKVKYEEEEEEEEEEEILKIPAKHIAICQATRALRERNRPMNELYRKSIDCGSPNDNAQGAIGSSLIHSFKIDNRPSTPILVLKEALNVLDVIPKIDSNVEKITVENDSECQQEEVYSPIVSCTTQEYEQPLNLLSPSPEWPPANQEAAKGLPLLLDAEKREQGIPGSIYHNQTEPESILSNAPWSTLFTPILLPADPEDTSILEPLDALDETIQVDDVLLHPDDWSLDCSFPEMIQPEDWSTFDNNNN
ncbi:hypothetical protein BGZ46_006042 [Entomortierella lignicola]|nr:hypothetical protein BGZ46_006042 [Entomortierella lignicola]